MYAHMLVQTIDHSVSFSTHYEHYACKNNLSENYCVAGLICMLCTISKKMQLEYLKLAI